MSTPVSEDHASSFRAREVSAPTAVIDGVWAVPVPLHGSPLHSIIVYLIETTEGLILIDAGYEHPSCWESFQASVTAIGRDVAEIRWVLLTHNHPDHVGFAERVRELSGAKVAMGRADDFASQESRRGGFLAQLRNALALTGAPADVVETMYAEAIKVAHHTESLELDVVLDADTDITLGGVTVRAMHAPGHTYGHTVYVDSRGLVFTGDTMMAEGPTQLAIPSLPEDNPAADLFATLDRIRDLAAEIACPAHQFAYRDVAARAEELKAFHLDEVAAVRALMSAGSTAWEVAPLLPRAKPWDELGNGTKRFALVHTLALMRGVE
ncbi:MBL fold metallo-hydrolase [Nocardioides marmoriginsengisoli]|uniref:MBL fold metallo-hydrolase n=1 Tax=Nocardioides marmoriginsengisoli TaxID=661483 RepID=A0A3N0CEU8_9ACTN|nr:MBL fold metallo-hydrolase [Nocardioides marmoriginsengisoli]RNL61958.1 MBL fold metallo-hydrolase [Nocardioides marmoriginsengisoli]